MFQNCGNEKLFTNVYNNPGSNKFINLTNGKQIEKLFINKTGGIFKIKFLLIFCYLYSGLILKSLEKTVSFLEF